MPRLSDGSLLDSIGRVYSPSALRRKHAAATKHGARYTPEYRAWVAMIQRCINPHVKSYPRYGGRGIRVCARWLLFPAFIRDMGQRPSSDHSIERLDNDGHYNPRNCRWATRAQQRRNTSMTRRLPWGDSWIPMVDWAKRAGLPYDTVAWRLKAGWTIARIRRTPCRVYRKRS